MESGIWPSTPDIIKDMPIGHEFSNVDEPTENAFAPNEVDAEQPRGLRQSDSQSRHLPEFRRHAGAEGGDVIETVDACCGRPVSNQKHRVTFD
jgi:hypothetical protein